MPDVIPILQSGTRVRLECRGDDYGRLGTILRYDETLLEFPETGLAFTVRGKPLVTDPPVRHFYPWTQVKDIRVIAMPEPTEAAS